MEKNKGLGAFISAGKEEDKNLLGALFSKSSWFLKLKGIELSGKKEPLKAQIKPVEEPKKAPVPIKIEVPKELADTSEPVKVELPKPESLTPKIPVGDSSKADKVKSYSVKGFGEYLKSLNSSWDVNDIAGIDSFSQNIKILFFGLDEIAVDELPEHPPISLIESEQDLLGKMIKAMGIGQGEFARLPIFKEDNPTNSLLAAVEFFKPEIVISLGASATNIALDKRVKLSAVHGEIFHQNFEINGANQVVTISPLFHPQLLEINQSMKRTAWLDMQKVMEFIKNR